MVQSQNQQWSGKSILAWAGLVLLFACGIVVSLKSLRQGDVWWMLETGEWILDNGQFITFDPFSYTFTDTGWINVKWGFEVLLYLFSQLGGPEFTLVLQAFVTVFILYFFYRSYQTFQDFFFEHSKHYPSISWLLTGFILLIGCEYRFNGRPEMISHLMTVVFLFLLYRYRLRPTKLIFWLIPLQVIWTNFHEAFGTGMVIMGTALAGFWIEYWFFKNTAAGRPKKLTWAVGLAFLGVMLNPYGYQMLLHPLNIFTQLQENKFTVELYAFTTSDYWQYQAYISSSVFILSVIALYLPLKKAARQARWYIRPVHQFGITYPVLLLLFFYLSLTAYRNIPFFLLVAAPLLALGLDSGRSMLYEWLQKRGLNISYLSYTAYGGLFIMGCLFYGAIVSNWYYKKTDARDQYGLMINTIRTPVGAGQFIKQHHLKGPCFSDYNTSSYLLWQHYPNFKTYIDLRDLDIFPSSFFQEFFRVVNQPQAFQRADAQYNFNYVVLHRPKFLNLHKHLYNSRKWQLVFVDPVAAIYVKDTSINQSIIDQYDITTSHYRPVPEPVYSTFSYTISKLLNPFYAPEFKEPVNYDMIAASYYQSVGALELSLQYAQRAVQQTVNQAQAYNVLGDTYLNLVFTASQNQQASKYLQGAQEAYQHALQRQPKNPKANLGLGICHMYQQKWQYAIHYLEAAIEVRPDYRDALLKLSDCYLQLAAQNQQYSRSYLQQHLDYLKRAYETAPEQPMLKVKLGIGYCRLNQCQKAKTLFDQFPYLDRIPQQQRQLVEDCFQRCGYEL